MIKYCGTCKYEKLHYEEPPCSNCINCNHHNIKNNHESKEDKDNVNSPEHYNEEEKDCDNCKHYYKDLDEYPCTYCEYHNGPEDKWEPKETQDNVNSSEEIRKEFDYIGEVCDELHEFLLKKNNSYGNSVIDPVRIFSKTDPIEQLNVRIDDKLSRLIRGKQYADEDTELDLIGYLIMKRVYKKINGEM